MNRQPKDLRERVSEEFSGFLRYVNKTSLHVNPAFQSLLTLRSRYPEAPDDILAALAVVRVMHDEEHADTSLAISRAINCVQRVYSMPVRLGRFALPGLSVPKRSVEEYRYVLGEYFD